MQPSKNLTVHYSLIRRIPVCEPAWPGSYWTKINLPWPCHILSACWPSVPPDKTAISGLAISFLKLGHPERAVVVLNRGLQFLPGDTLLLKLKGEALSSRRETAGQAVKVYADLLQIQPGKAEWAQARQTALLAASYSYFEARAHLKKAIGPRPCQPVKGPRI